jgi:uncharacterized sulfatase
MERRKFLQKTAKTGIALATTSLVGYGGSAASNPSRTTKPNILFIIVDELRFPRVFPKGVSDAAGFLKEFMPNTYSLWSGGVKFAGHYTAATACTPARGTLVTGLYAQQSWLLTTILSDPTTKVSQQPVLNRAYPTYGKLLRTLGYQTPYVGKWHLSIVHARGNALDAYGFDGMTFPDPTGVNLQGTVGNPPEYLNDEDIANEAARWLRRRRSSDAPWCLTVGFINPHDKEFFPAGTEFETFNDLFTSTQTNPNGYSQFINYSVSAPNSDPLKEPPSLPYPPTPRNWESADRIMKNKPALQTSARNLQQAIWGGVSDDSKVTGFTIVALPTNPNLPPLSPPDGICQAPFSYWKRSLDSYTQIMKIVDGRIGEVLAALPDEVAENTVIVFTSDHGEYASAHGFVSGKAGSAYDEVFNVPLIVFDPTGRFTGDIGTIRTGLTSSVDILPMLVSLGNGGSNSWMTGDYAQIYGKRHDMLSMLKSGAAPGRQYVVFTYDEVVPDIYNSNNARGHIIGVRSAQNKLGAYSDWIPLTTDIEGLSELEYYDYTKPHGLLELDNDKNNPNAVNLYQTLLADILPNELRAPLPSSLTGPQTVSKSLYVLYVQLINALTSGDLPFRIGDI